ncbi:F-box domain-containing protein [Caenorhabditis elegans]|uniref:F-box domain-containing protein n=1 Tax=Caenorhabditis elegans TaxID=6239 RepID=A7DT43_CAEEL|nr:F-box domain-containing protein [Caenorhabditis elegans]CCD72680.1 F-box domain-containing protein [Caenorhabditis elegans]|eukprot:NP_493992.2 Uncharacterized protein CELE_K05F6.4 [Caenorhabditis elegans]
MLVKVVLFGLLGVSIHFIFNTLPWSAIAVHPCLRSWHSSNSGADSKRADVFCTTHSHSANFPALVMVAPSFPLLRLPLTNLKYIFRNMKITELTCCSLISKRTKHFIRQFCIFKDLLCNIGLFMGDALFYTISRNGNRLFSCYLKNGEFCVENSDRIEIKLLVDVKSWLNNLIYIFDLPKIKQLYFELTDGNFDEQRFQMLKELLNGIPIENLFIKFNTETDHIVKLFTTFPPINYFKFWHPLKPSQLTELRPVLSQRFCELDLIADVSLDELLLTSSPRIQIISHILTDKEINVFLKHWMAGLQPELEYLAIFNYLTNRVFNPNAILEGIPHEIAPPDREFDMCGMTSERGGIDIWLHQGIKATIVFAQINNISKISIAVHDTEYISFK